MRTPVLRALLTMAILPTAAFGLAACGGGDDDSSSSGGGGSQGASDRQAQLLEGTASENKPGEGKKGGTLTMLAAGDVDFIDPGMTYYSFAIGIMDALHRRLYSYEPDKPSKATPDLAESDPQISADGKTVTVKIRKGVKFSPPVNREVTSKDVKYGIERAFSANVTNGYARAYMSDIVGVDKKPGPVKEISGITTPDDQTLVIKLTRPTGAVVAGALGMPISTPVPKEYAAKFDKESPSTYGQHQVFTGPYQIEHDASGKLTGYQPNRFIHIERNPNYENIGDYRPAFVDKIRIEEGNDDSNVASRRILDGTSLISGDGGVPPTVLKRALTQNKDQISMKPSGGFRYVAFNTKAKPFNDINVRKAVIAGFDRNALRLARGGEAVGPIAEHFIPPGIPGFEEAGGLNAPAEADWMKNPQGDKALMAKYFKAAGFSSGKYEGGGTLLMVSDNADPDKSIGQVAERQLEEMGFNVKLRLVNRNTMFTKYCNVPDSGVQVCPSVGWLKDFSDAQTMLDPTFNGENILPTNNSNWPQLDVPEINKAMDKAKLINDPDQRAQAWGDIDKQVTLAAPGIPYVWDYENVVASKNVRIIQNQFSTLADLSFTSLK